MSMHEDFIGVDVAKDWIDIHELGTGRARRIGTTARELRAFANEAEGVRPEQGLQAASLSI